MKTVDLSGNRFGRLTAISKAPRRNKATYWLCSCDCGTKKEIAYSSLVRGQSTSCGCFQKEINKTNGIKHGKCYSREYRIWIEMRRRCFDERHRSYELYGKKGISVCPEWLYFPAFINDMGECPDGFSIDRIDNSLGYSKENCRWASPRTQARNRTNNVIIKYKGEEVPLIIITERLGLNYKTFWTCIKRGWDVERAIDHASILR